MKALTTTEAVLYGSSKGRDLRKSAQSTIQNARYKVESKKASAALEEALQELQGRSGLTSEEKVERLNAARDAVKQAASHKKVVGTDVAEALEGAAKELKKAAKQYA
jgi:hypothetical protein